MKAPRSRASFRRGARGFSLLEVLAALSLVGIAAALLLPVALSGVRTTLAAATNLEAAHRLRSELEAWAAVAETLDFASLPTAAATHFAAIGGVQLTGAQWVEFLDEGGGVIVEAESAAATDHLKITIRETTTGQVLSRIYTKVPS